MTDGTPDLINDELTKRLDVQRAMGDRVSTWSSFAVVFAAGSLYFTAQHLTRGGLFVVAVVCDGVAIVAGLAALFVRDVSTVPEPRPFVDQYADAERDVVLRALVAAKVIAFERNVPIYRRRARACRTSHVAIAVASLTTAVSYGIGGHRCATSSDRKTSLAPIPASRVAATPSPRRTSTTTPSPSNSAAARC